MSKSSLFVSFEYKRRYFRTKEIHNSKVDIICYEDKITREQAVVVFFLSINSFY